MMQEFARDKDWVDRQYEIERQLRAENEKLGRALHGDAAIVAELRADRNTAHADRVALEEENVKLRAEVERLRGKIAQFIHGEDHPDMYVTRQEAQDLRAQLATAVKRIDDLEVLLHRWLTTCDDGSCLCGSDDSGYLCPKHATLKVLKEAKP